MPGIDPNDPRPPYQQIANDLRRKISEGEFGAGARLPSSRELAIDYGVAPMTVHQGIKILRDEGIVTSVQGRGVYVRSDADSGPSEQLPAEIVDMQRRLDALAAHLPNDTQEEIAELRRQIGVLQAQLIDLYARTGHPYPQKELGRATDSPRRRAVGK